MKAIDGCISFLFEFNIQHVIIQHSQLFCLPMSWPNITLLTQKPRPANTQPSGQISLLTSQTTRKLLIECIYYVYF